MMPVTEREKKVAFWSLDRCKDKMLEIRKARGNNRRVWSITTAETYEVLERRVALLQTIEEATS